MFGFRRYRNALSGDERKIIQLLLDGDTEFLATLRAQLLPPFHRRIERRTPKSKPSIYRTPANEYHIDLVYDDRLSDKFSADTRFSMRIDDLVVVDRRLSEQLLVEGYVNHGILVNVVFRTHEPVRWPKCLRADDWWYTTEDGISKKCREDLGHLRHPIHRAEIADLPSGWFRDFLHTAFDQGTGMTIRLPATKESVAELSQRIPVPLPGDFVEFLRNTDGASFRDVVVLGCNEVFELDERDFGARKVAFSQAPDGSMWAFDLSDYTGGPEYPVLFFGHDSEETSQTATSFRIWLELLADS